MSAASSRSLCCSEIAPRPASPWVVCEPAHCSKPANTSTTKERETQNKRRASFSRIRLGLSLKYVFQVRCLRFQQESSLSSLRAVATTPSQRQLRKAAAARLQSMSRDSHLQLCGRQVSKAFQKAGALTRYFTALLHAFANLLAKWSCEVYCSCSIQMATCCVCASCH